MDCAVRGRVTAAGEAPEPGGLLRALGGVVDDLDGPGYGTGVASTRDTLQIDPSSPIPLHEQVAGAIRRAIAEGEAKPGERLPPARDLATVLGVNANTVFRALRTLRDEGLVEFRRGRGVTVTGAAPARSDLIGKARELVELARRYGYGREELEQIMRQVG